MPRSPLTEKFLRIVALRDEVKTWPQDEQDFFLDMLTPEPAKKPQKKSTERIIEHCAACDYTRRAKVHKDATADGYHEFQPSGKKPAGKGGGGKSRGELLKGQLDSRRQEQRKATTDKDDEFPNLLGEHKACVFDLRGQQCGAAADANVHHLNTSIDYHEFVAPPATHAGKSDAQSVAGGL